jgi:hypothetical protein
MFIFCGVTFFSLPREESSAKLHDITSKLEVHPNIFRVLSDGTAPQTKR